MPNFIVLRLTPPTATDAATFTNSLTNLTVTVYDISYGQPIKGVQVGLPAPFIPGPPPPFPAVPGPGVVQHKDAGLFQSVATAVIEYNAPGPEFENPDLLIQFDWGTQPIFASQIYYDAPLYSNPLFPAYAAFQTIPDSSVSAFVTLPPPTTLLTIPTDGSPPSFDDLLAGVTAVLTADPGPPVTPALIAGLTVDQCRNIANEIIYGPEDPLPNLPVPYTLEDMFTAPGNDGTVGNLNEQARQQFEAQLSGYYGIRNVAVLRLTNYVFALSVAYWLEGQTQSATQALITFPVNPNLNPPDPIPTRAETQIIVSGAPAPLGLDVPAQYFYALNYDVSALPGQDDLQQKQARQQVVYGAGQQANLNRLTSAIKSSLIDLQPTRNPAQAVRILDALNIPAGSTAPLWPIAVASAQPIVVTGWTLFEVGWGATQQSWLAFPPTATWAQYQPGDDFAGFWQPLATNEQAAFLDLVMMALTQGFLPAGAGGSYLAEIIIANFGLASVNDIKTVTPAQWQAFFTANPGYLPPFTQPGTVAARIAAFVQWVQTFFQLNVAGTVLNSVAAEVLPRFGIPKHDLIAQTIAAYPGFFFGMAINFAQLEAAAILAIPGDEAAQAWAVQTVETLNELYILSQIPGQTSAFDFSVMEALFARGFTSREDVLDLPFDNFQQALTGTIAYDHAAAIYALAGPPLVFPPPVPGGFGPINPGDLTDCIPPLEYSPLGPVAYLHDMLQVSQRSTCDHPFAPPAPGHKKLQTLIDGRRGPIETLAVTRANLETPLPLIDIANECLELMASKTPPVPPGAVYDTSQHHLGPYKLCDDHCENGDDHHDCACEPECHCDDERHTHPDCHKPAAIFAALPEYSTPATPVAANSAVDPTVWNKLKADFGACCLPYDQALDVNRTYLDFLRTCRFETMRTFRKCITEFVLDPVNQPADFQTHLWRYPVRLDIAIEYLGFSQEEYEVLFKGVLPWPCDGPRFRRPPPPPAGRLPDECLRESIDGRGRIALPDFLECVCLTYCEFIELWRSGFVPFGDEHDRKNYPECEPCCLDDLWVPLPREDPSQWIWTIAVFVHLWRKLRHLCGAGYSFAELADICKVLGFGGPDFIRQLAAFQMLRDQFELKLTGREGAAAGATGAGRTFLLSLWVGPAAKHWRWALRQLLEGIVKHAKCRHECRERGPEFIKLLEDNFDPLSRLAGFDPANPTETWHSAPTHTLRFAELLAKIYASDFSVGEVLFLFTADTHLDGDDPFPLQDLNEAEDLPLDLPHDAHRHSLWVLRHDLLRIRTQGDEADAWTWPRIEAALEQEFGFPAAEVTSLGQHFFPDQSGQPVSPTARRFQAPLAATSPAMWNASPEGPFRYDAAAGANQLWAVLPIADRDVLRQLARVSSLTPVERQTVQAIYFQPRLLLSQFAMLFDNFEEAEQRLIEESNGEERWRWFERQFRQARARCEAIVDHLARHVAAATGDERPEGIDAARLTLRHLFADENATTAPSWEIDSGAVPPVTWTPPANGGSFAALLGLVGTGLDGVFTAGGAEVWREIRDAMRPFGADGDRENCPVPTVIPAMNLALTPQQLAHVSVHNGLAMIDTTGQWLGGAQGFAAHWRGVLLIDADGDYVFHAGAPSEGRDEPSLPEAHGRSWKIILRRGQKTWVLLRHHWHGEADVGAAPLRLRRGAYELDVEFVQHHPDFLHDPLRQQHTGFEIKYRGPDTHEHLVTVPRAHLYRSHVDAPMRVAGLTGAAAAFLRNRYGSSLRDIRRTYQRAFKAALFVHRFALSAVPRFGKDSELTYMLTQAANFAGWSTYSKAGVWTTHKADFDFNFLPVGDPYRPPNNDDRFHPSAKRVKALFDWWERIFDYTRMRKEVRAHSDRHLWLLFEEARDVQPVDPDSLLRHMGADERHWQLDLTFFQNPAFPAYSVTSANLMDDRWTVRAWHAELWLRRLWCHFTVKDITKARPNLWAADDPAIPVAGESGNANLLRFVCDGCFDNGKPLRYEDVRRLNDGLRERGREALICYLCGPGGIAHNAEELSEILLLDVRAGLSERASRIEEAISAVQTFIRRARMGLEPGWIVSGAFVHLWDCRFISYRVWQACRRRELYKENWIDWHELEKASKIEAFGFLDAQLKRATLTIAAPGGVDFWPDHLPPSHPALCLLQRRDPAEMQLLDAPREGLDLLATPERTARPSWITTVPEPAAQPLAGVALAPPAAPAPKLPFWMECAIRLGARFIRVAAAKYPPASTEFRPRHRCDHDAKRTDRGHKDWECCDTCCTECGCEHPAHIDEYYFWLIDSKYYTPKTQPVYTGDYDGEQNEFYDQNAQSSTPWHDPMNLAFSNGVNAATSAATAAGDTLHFAAAPAGVTVGMFVIDMSRPSALPAGTIVTSVGANIGVSNPVAGAGVATGDTILFAAVLYDLLTWPSSPMVRLAWCRVHNGEFQQPRRSDWGIPYDPAGGAPDLRFLGRSGDSLYFDVTNPADAGFRYDMVPDRAREFENIVVPPSPPLPPPWPPLPPPWPPGAFFPYPYFCYYEPGARLFPWSLYSPTIAVAHALRAHCRFEAALKWYELVYKPLDRDNRWALCGEPRHEKDSRRSDDGDKALNSCCDTTDITCRDARHRSLLLHFLDTLMEWGDALMRRNSPEAFQQARVAFDMMRKLMGRHPRVVKNPMHPPQTVATFKPLWASINPRLMNLYDRLDDRLSLIHERESHRRLVEMQRRIDGQYWDDDEVRGGRRDDRLGCCEPDGSCRPCTPYRFVVRIQKAKELAAQTRELGALLLGAFEKGDAEFLASVRARHDRELAHLNLKVREDAWRDADWQVQALGKLKLSLQASRLYYANLIANGLNANENAYVANMNQSMAERTAGNIAEGIAEITAMVPDLFVGTVDFAQIPVGTKLAGISKTVARICNTLADISSTSAALDLTEAGWDRRLQDWVHQVQVLDIQIEQTELQILGAERRRNQTLRELNIQQRTIEQTNETLDILRDKFTNHALYLFLQKKTAELHRMIYGLALDEAYEAERALNFERGDTTQKFISDDSWDNLHEGLLAGETLQLQLSHLEKAYFDRNCREYELTKHISVLLNFPTEFLRLKATGQCDIEIPEWMFDLDYPGQYMRRIRNVSLTIPCVAGPYNEVHCRLTLLRSGTRIDPLPTVPAARCCNCCQSGNGYPVCPHDPRWVTQNGALEAIATSSGQNDAGLFELNFRDERYLPFEFHGAVSRWRIELPPENNYFDMDSLSDVVIHLNYTAREGGEALRRAAREASACDLPGAGWRLFDLRHDFADAWELFGRQRHDEDERHGRPFDLRFTRSMFPFVPVDRELYITKMALLFDRPDHCGCECPSECPCCADPRCTHHELKLRRRGKVERQFECGEGAEWPRLYHGVAECLSIGPIHGRRDREELKIEFPRTIEDIDCAYLLCRYELRDKCCSREEPASENRERVGDKPFGVGRLPHELVV
jgi:Tc toxin complex TcA C-terminal TcB-binding domain